LDGVSGLIALFITLEPILEAWAKNLNQCLDVVVVIPLPGDLSGKFLQEALGLSKLVRKTGAIGGLGPSDSVL